MLSTLVHIKDNNELRNHCAFCFLFFISTANRFFWTNGATGESSHRGKFVVSLLLEFAIRNGQCCSLLSKTTVSFISFTHWTMYDTIPSSLTPQTSPVCHNFSQETVVSYLTLRTSSVFLILTKINLLSSRLFLVASKCLFHTSRRFSCFG